MDQAKMKLRGENDELIKRWVKLKGEEK